MHHGQPGQFQLAVRKDNGSIRGVDLAPFGHVDLQVQRTEAAALFPVLAVHLVGEQAQGGLSALRRKGQVVEQVVAVVMHLDGPIQQRSVFIHRLTVGPNQFLALHGRRLSEGLRAVVALGRMLRPAAAPRSFGVEIHEQSIAFRVYPDGKVHLPPVVDSFFHRKGCVPGLAGRLKDGSLHQLLGFGLQIGPQLPAQRVQHAQSA